ncbi:unnamed protein product [Psylliodes chrysocephalus]|uniref:CCHC-type domain-containing protein n=1 Tax=Psylliodes chrysocephalus TaxID=3402493 RepID=A0A9P0GF76_9CUCU|nr:unnamed protein product [Psylliodes chrysocephala]
MDTNEEVFTVQGLGTPVPVQVEGVEAGPTGPSASYCGSSSMDPQVERSINITGANNCDSSSLANQDEKSGPITGITITEMDINPFSRRDSINRTPTKGTKANDESIKEPETKEDTPEQQTKRKRIELTTQNVEKQCEIKGSKYEENVDKALKVIGQLEKLVGSTYKPKKELTDITFRLTHCAQKIRKERRESGIENTKKETTDIEKRLRIENQDLKMQLENLKEKLLCLTEITTNKSVNQEEKCEACKEADRKKNRRKVLKLNESLESFEQVTEEDWGEEIFTRLKEIKKPIWDVPNEYSVIIPCNVNFGSKHKYIATALDRFGGKTGLKTQNKTTGEIARMTYSLGFPDEGGHFNFNFRNLYYPIVEEATRELDHLTLFQTIKEVRNLLQREGKEKIAVPELEGVEGEILKRMLEYLFVDTSIEIVVCKEVIPLKRNRRSTLGENLTEKPRKSRKEAILVKSGEQTYAELLKTVKQKINPDDLGVQVKEIKKTRNGDLLLTVENGFDKTEILEKKIKEELPQTKTSLLLNKKILHIRDLDETITIEEIREAIASQINVNPGSFEVRALRPSHSGLQNATVVITEEGANKLNRERKLKVGWTQCRIEERKKELKCYRCWEYGHTREKCTGQDRENSCMKCSKEGHKANECQNKAYCINCKQEGHQTGNRKCTKNKNHPQQAIENDVFSNPQNGLEQ